MEDRARRTDLHVQVEARDPVPRRLAVDRRRREGQLRQDHRAAARRRQLSQEQLHGGRAGRGPGREHGGVPAQVPVCLRPRQSRVALERDLPEEVPGSGSQLLQDACRGLRAVQVQELHARVDLRGREESRLLRQGPPLSRRVQVLHQHGDLRAGGRHPVRARIRGVPRHAPGRGGGDPKAARGQGHRPGNARERAVGHRAQQHPEAVQRRPGPQGRSRWGSIDTRRAACSIRSTGSSSSAA